ncbi:MAG TPA: RNA polymerase sigma factor [Fimbriiglobus sp.]|jgi:RNA polymerase sigma factor (sigma-70 family)|nr:RNA polymerase sigma factor [Fimbriiglobus sp.]
MSSNPRGLLRAALRTLAPDPPADSDAELLGRYVAARDQDAFAALVRRHGPMVHGVCRRRLRGTDADDAFQVTFMVLARDAAKVARRESLPGWLYRVAYLVALKLAGKTARREADPLMDHDAATRADPHDEAATKELKDALDQELAALPDRLRAVVVLCGLEERTNAEAAKLLGCPVGTVDSRLSAARKALKARLTHRGLALTAGVTLEALLRPGPAIALSELIDRTTLAAVAYATGGTVTDPLTQIADGVTPTMGIAKLKLWAAAGMSVALFGPAGLGLMSAPAGQEKGKPKDPPAAAAKADPPRKADAPRVEGTQDGLRPEPGDEAALRRLLAERAPEVPDGIAMRELLEQLYKQFGLIARLDTGAYMRAGPPDDFGPHQFYEAKVKLPVTRGMSVADLLTDVLAQLPLPTDSGPVPFTYRVRDNQVLIVPAYKPPVVPGMGAHLEPGSVTPFVDQKRLLEQIVGQPVSLSIEEKPLTEAVKELRKLTGANIVIDARCKVEAQQPVSATFDDVRLLSALQLLADMCGLKPVAMNNVYYVTTPENAARLQKEVSRDLFGEPQSASPTIAVPAGFVTDGYHYFPRTADMKPVESLGGGIGGFQPVPAPPQPAPPEKKDAKPAPTPEKK